MQHKQKKLLDARHGGFTTDRFSCRFEQVPHVKSFWLSHCAHVFYLSSKR